MDLYSGGNDLLEVGLGERLKVACIDGVTIVPAYLECAYSHGEMGGMISGDGRMVVDWDAFFCPESALPPSKVTNMSRSFVITFVFGCFRFLPLNLQL